MLWIRHNDAIEIRHLSINRTWSAGQIYDHLLSNIDSTASIGGQRTCHTAEVAGMRGMGTRGEGIPNKAFCGGC